MKSQTGLALLIAACVVASALYFAPPSKAFNQNGALTREEPFSFFAVATISATPVYGPAANAKAVDGIYVAVTGSPVMTDQNGNSVTFTAVPAGVVIPVSPANITNLGAATLILLYK